MTNEINNRELPYRKRKGEVTLSLFLIEGLAAEAAGITVNDVIIEIAGVESATQESLRGVLLSKEPGDVIGLTIVREGDEEDIEVELIPYEAASLGLSAPEGVRRMIFPNPEGHDIGNYEKLAEGYFRNLGKFEFDEEQMADAQGAFEEGRTSIGSLRITWCSGEPPMSTM